MNYTQLGRTGLRVSVMGLGAGGHSRLGQATGGSEDDSVGIVRRALELGVNFIDTAEAYGTEAIVGRGISGRARDGVVLSTKKSVTRQKQRVEPADVARGLEESLRKLGTEWVDVYHLHGVSADDYDYARDALAPEIAKLRQAGKVRFVGITEAFGSDPGHKMLSRAVDDDCWDVMMVGFNVLNQSARQRVLPQTRAKGIGVLDMFAVRSALSRPEKLRETVKQLVAEGRIEGVDEADPLGFVLRDGPAGSVTEAAYRFCRDEPGIHVVLSGTGDVKHLEENVAAMDKPPLSAGVREKLGRLFARVDHVSGQ